MTNTQIIGIVAFTLFTFVGVPLAYIYYKKKHGKNKR